MMTVGLIGLAVLLAIAWLVGLVVFKVAGFALHVVLVLALITFIASFFTRRTIV